MPSLLSRYLLQVMLDRSTSWPLVMSVMSVVPAWNRRCNHACNKTSFLCLNLNEIKFIILNLDKKNVIEHWSPNQNKPCKLFSCCAQRNWENHGQLYQGRDSWIPASSRIARLFSWRLKRGSVSAEEQTQRARNKNEANMSNKIVEYTFTHRDSYIWIPIWITIQHDSFTDQQALCQVIPDKIVYQTEISVVPFWPLLCSSSDTPGSVTQHSLVAMLEVISRSCSIMFPQLRKLQKMSRCSIRIKLMIGFLRIFVLRLQRMSSTGSSSASFRATSVALLPPGCIGKSPKGPSIGICSERYVRVDVGDPWWS